MSAALPQAVILGLFNRAPQASASEDARACGVRLNNREPS